MGAYSAGKEHREVNDGDEDVVRAPGRGTPEVVSNGWGREKVKS